jgi:hypothetical protein
MKNILKTKRIKTTNIKCHYNNLQYEFDIPENDKITFKDILDNFGTNYFEEIKTFKNFQIFRKEYIDLNQKIKEFKLDEPFLIYDFELTKKSFLNRTKKPEISSLEFPNIFLYELYQNQKKTFPINLIPNMTDVVLKDLAKNVFNKESNFFNYLLNKFDKKFAATTELLNKFDKINNSFETEDNRINISNQNTYKQFLVELFSPFVEYRNLSNNKFIIDFDYLHSGIDTEEFKSDLILKSTDDNFILPVSIIKNFDGQNLKTNTKDKADKLFLEGVIGKIN